LLNTKSLTMSGFMIAKLIKREGDFNFYPSVTKLVQDGQLKVRENVVRSLADAAQLLLDVQKGDNTGKAVVELAAA